MLQKLSLGTPDVLPLASLGLLSLGSPLLALPSLLLTPRRLRFVIVKRASPPGCLLVGVLLVLREKLFWVLSGGQVLPEALVLVVP